MEVLRREPVIRFKGKASFVYIIEAMDYPNLPPGFCKIGKSDDPDGRVKQLSTGSPFPLVLRATYRYNFSSQAHRIEQLFKWNFGNLRVNGEWYRMSADDAILHMDQLIGIKAAA